MREILIIRIRFDKIRLIIEEWLNNCKISKIPLKIDNNYLVLKVNCIDCRRIQILKDNNLQKNDFF
jgi:hypothetical protein